MCDRGSRQDDLRYGLGDRQVTQPGSRGHVLLVLPPAGLSSRDTGREVRLLADRALLGHREMAVHLWQVVRRRPTSASL